MKSTPKPKKPKETKQEGTLGNTNALINPLGREFATLRRVMNGALVRHRAKTAFDLAREAQAHPSPEQKWLLENWRGHASDKLFFVTDGDFNLVRNNGGNYIVDLEGRIDEERRKYLLYRRNFQIILVKPFDAASLEKAQKMVDLIHNPPVS